MTIPQTTPLLLLSEVQARINAKSATDTADNIRNRIIGMSNLVQRLAGRRFDERVDTRYFDALSVNEGGPINPPNELLVDDDLKAVTTLTNGDGSIVAASGYTLLPRAVDACGVLAYRRVRLSPNGAVFWTSGGNDWKEAIAVAGRWGYGGQWISVGALAADITDSATTFTLAGLEVGMTLKIDSEYLYVDAVSPSNLFVRAYNGSTAAAHTNGTAVFRWQALDLARGWVARLVLWSIEQDKSPFFGQAVIGDATLLVSTEGLPKDVILGIAQSGLKRILMPAGV